MKARSRTKTPKRKRTTYKCEWCGSESNKASECCNTPMKKQ